MINNVSVLPHYYDVCTLVDVTSQNQSFVHSTQPNSKGTRKQINITVHVKLSVERIRNKGSYVYAHAQYNNPQNHESEKVNCSPRAQLQGSF